MRQNIKIDQIKNVLTSRSAKELISIRNVLLLIINLLIGFGVWEAILGWEQLLGYKSSHHNLFPVTGSFYNPGPYCLFLGILCPLALNHVLKCNKSLSQGLAFLYLILAISIMPILRGRTGWISAVIGMFIILFGIGYIKCPAKKNLKIYIILTMVIVIVISILLYKIKPDSALGRFFLWKIGLSALLENPLKGVGWSKVPGILGEMQEKYFANHPDTIFSKVAGTPEWAFNEYLQIGIAYGIPVLILFFLILYYTIYYSWKRKEYGLTGALVALAIGCIGSYPFRFQEFVVLTIILMICSVFSQKLKSQNLLGKLIFSIVIITVGWFNIRVLNRNKVVEEEWNLKKSVYSYKLSEKNIKYLDSIMERYNENSKFIFDFGKALRETKLYEHSNKVLKRGLNVSSDPMFLNLIGRNYQDLGEPIKAEEFYKRSINRLPGRLYPYYLLAKLYADTLFLNKEKFMETYLQALNLEPKVMSPAIKQMKEELKELYDKINQSECTL